MSHQGQPPSPNSRARRRGAAARCGLPLRGPLGLEQIQPARIVDGGRTDGGGTDGACPGGGGAAMPAVHASLHRFAPVEPPVLVTGRTGKEPAAHALHGMSPRSPDDAGDIASTLVDGLDDVRVQAEKEAVLTTLRESGFNVSECARRLRVSRVTVYRLCRKHQLELETLRV